MKAPAYRDKGFAVVKVGDPEAVVKRYTLPHPKYVSAKRRGAYIPPSMPRKLSFAEARPGGYVAVPLPCYNPERLAAPRPQFETFRFQQNSFEPLRTYQYDATEILKRPYGILQAPAGSGKTMVMLAMLHHIAMPSLVVVPTIDIAKQWQARASKFWPELEVGIYGGGSKKEGLHVTVTTYQSAEKIPSLDRYGVVVVDECHRTPCESIVKTLARCPARYRYGCTATPTRSDGLEKAFDWLLGGVVHVIDRADIGEAVMPVKIERIETGLDFIAGDYNELQNLIAAHEFRNCMIVNFVTAERDARRKTIALCTRVEQARFIAGATGFDVITGKTPKKEREKIIFGVAKGSLPGIVATYPLAAEGLDIPSLETLIMAAPIGNAKTVEQACGRIARPHPGKGTPTVYDLRDGGGMCRALSRKRDKVYRRLGYDV